MTKTLSAAILTLALSAFQPLAATAAEIKVLTAGAYKSVLVAIQPQFELQTGHKLVIDNETVGGLSKRIEAGEAFDVVVSSPAAIEDLSKKGKVATGTSQTLARVGVGVMVKDGAPKPDVSSLAAFKATIQNAKSIAYIDPASGGSSGVYLAGLFEKLGLAETVKPKAKLKQGGYVADLILSGDAELGIHQISEILPVKGVTLVGPLPAEIQNYTVYAAGLSAGARDVAASKALISALAGPMAAPVLKAKGMDAGS